MTHYKTTIGGALSALGTTLMGIGLVPQVAEGPSEVLTYVALSGFVLNAVGTFLVHLFAADKEEVKKLIEASETNTKRLINGQK